MIDLIDYNCSNYYYFDCALLLLCRGWCWRPVRKCGRSWRIRPGSGGCSRSCGAVRANDAPSGDLLSPWPDFDLSDWSGSPPIPLFADNKKVIVIFPWFFIIISTWANFTLNERLPWSVVTWLDLTLTFGNFFLSLILPTYTKPNLDIKKS